MKRLFFLLVLSCSCIPDAQASYDPPAPALRTLAPVGASQTVDLRLGRETVQKIDLEGSSATVAVTFSNPPAGPTSIALLIQQSTASPNRTITLTNAKWPGGVVPVTTAVADAIDTIYCVWNGTTTYYCDLGADYR